MVMHFFVGFYLNEILLRLCPFETEMMPQTFEQYQLILFVFTAQ